jgi:hypothetical protein
MDKSTGDWKNIVEKQFLKDKLKELEVQTILIS